MGKVVSASGESNGLAIAKSGALNRPALPQSSPSLGTYINSEAMKFGALIANSHIGNDNNLTSPSTQPGVVVSVKPGMRCLSYDGSQGRLQDQLFGAIKGSWSYDHPRGFLPKGQLSGLVTQTAVEMELSKYEASLRKRLQIWKPPADIQTEARSICGGVEHGLASDTEDEQHARHVQQPSEKSYRKIFAILLLIERPSRIRSFVEEGVCDADLPLVNVPRTNGLPGPFRLRRKNACSCCPLRCFRGWGGSTVARFEQSQWMVLAHSFARSKRKRDPDYKLQPEIIMPFTSWKKAAPRGGFGQVYRVEIHPDHHAFPNDEVGLPCCYLVHKC